MPIRKYLGSDVFEPEDISAMSQAFVRAVEPDRKAFSRHNLLMEATMFGRLIIGVAAILLAMSAVDAAGAPTTKQPGKPIEGRAVYVSPAGLHRLKGNDFGPDFNVQPVLPTLPKSSPS
jgi:hypothetical protein